MLGVSGEILNIQFTLIENRNFRKKTEKAFHASLM
jgi:hypothetical protein